VAVSKGETKPDFEGTVAGIEQRDVAALVLVVEAGQKHQARLYGPLVLQQDVAALQPAVGSIRKQRAVARLIPQARVIHLAAYQTA